MTWQALYPFTSQWHDLSGVQMHYLDEGAATAAPVLMVHGNPTWSFYWRNLILPLRESMRTIAVDHVGCGLSDKPAGYPYRLTQHTDNLIHLIETLDLNNITLVAHDWGGPIGLRAALALRSRFARIVLLNTGAFPPPFFPWRIRICRTPLLGRIAVQGFNLFARAAIRMAVSDHQKMTQSVKSGLLRPYDSWSHRPISPQLRTAGNTGTTTPGACPPASPADLGHAGLVLPSGVPASSKFAFTSGRPQRVGRGGTLRDGGCNRRGGCIDL